MRRKKSEVVFQELISRGDYLVVQGNDLAKAFGNLSAFEHKVLDYCFSFVQKDTLPEERFTLTIADLLKWLCLTSSGTNYKRVVKAFKKLNENTALYLPIEEDGVKGIMMTQLFGYINYFETGIVRFEFSKYAQPYVFDLKKNFYSFHLIELANIKGKYALILMKLWEAHRFGDSRNTLIKGTIDDWQDWFLGEDKRLPPGRFMYEVIIRSSEELETKFPIEIIVETHKRGRRVIGYEMEIIDKRQLRPVDFYKKINKIEKGLISSKEIQSDNYDFLKD